MNWRFRDEGVDLLALGLAALGVRVAYVLAIVARFGTSQFSDFHYLDQLAASLATGRGFTLAGGRIYNQSIGYPAAIAPLYALFGPDVRVVLALNVVLGVATVLLVYLLTLAVWRCDAPGRPGFREVPERRLARFAALLATLYPDSLLFTGFVGSENLLVPLLLASMLAALWRTRRDALAGAMTGLLAAAAVSTKAQVLFGYVGLPLVWFAMGRRSLVRTAAAAITAIVFLTPWTVVNYHDSGGYFIPFSVIAGEVFLDGTNPAARGRPTNVLSLGPEVEKGLHKVEIDRLKMKKAVGYIKERPAWYLQLLVRKLVLSMSPARDHVFEERGEMRLFDPMLTRWGPTAFNAALILGAILSLFQLRGRPAAALLALTMMIGLFSVQLIFVAYSRYRYPWLVCFLPYIALGWLVVLRRFVPASAPAASQA